MNMNSLARFAYVLLRLVAGWTFFQSGAVKILGWFGGMPAGQPPVEVLSQVWIGGMLELVGGLLILVGLFTKPTAFVLSGEMAVAYWQFHYGILEHRPWSWPVQNQGTPAVLYCFIFLYMAFQGSGPFSLDALFWRKDGGARDE